MGHRYVQPLFRYVRATLLFLVLSGLLFFGGLGMDQAYASEFSLNTNILNQAVGDTTPTTQSAPQKCELIPGQTPKGLNGNVRVRYDVNPPVGLGYVNNGGPCVWKVFLVSYRMIAMDNTFGQTIYDSTGVTVYPGQRLTLQVNVPPECRVQLDLVADQVMDLKNARTAVYHDTGRFIAATYDGGSHLCVTSTGTNSTTTTAAATTTTPTTPPATTATTTGPVAGTPASTTAVPTTVVAVTSAPATTTAAAGGYNPVAAATTAGSTGTVADTTRAPATATTTTRAPATATTTSGSVATPGTTSATIPGTTSAATTATSAPVSTAPASTGPTTVTGTVLGESSPPEGNGAATGPTAVLPAAQAPSNLPNSGGGGGSASSPVWWPMFGTILALLGLAGTCGLYLLRRRKA